MFPSRSLLAALMRTDTIFRIASMTKPFTAVGIMILVEEGRLALLDPKKDLVGVFLVQQPDVAAERSAFMAAASAISE